MRVAAFAVVADVAIRIHHSLLAMRVSIGTDCTVGTLTPDNDVHWIPISSCARDQYAMDRIGVLRGEHAGCSRFAVGFGEDGLHNPNKSFPLGTARVPTVLK